MSTEKLLIVNADDFGASSGVNRGILEGHCQGIVTSASLMVTGRAAHQAVALSRDYPDLSVGLHWDVTGEDEREFDMTNVRAVHLEIQRQLDRFLDLVGRPPTHVDSHHHMHLEEGALGEFIAVFEPLSIPVRGDGQVTYVGGFYGQWEWMVTDLTHVGVAFLLQLLREEVGAGWTELACHPGYRSPDFASVYSVEREEEVRTLTDPAVRAYIADLDIRLTNYAEYRPAPGPGQ